MVKKNNYTLFEHRHHFAWKIRKKRRKNQWRNWCTSKLPLWLVEWFEVYHQVDCTTAFLFQCRARITSITKKIDHTKHLEQGSTDFFPIPIASFINTGLGICLRFWINNIHNDHPRLSGEHNFYLQFSESLSVILDA